MFAFLKRAFLIVLGFVLIAVFIWYAGPYFAFADYRPLESATARLIAIAVVGVCWMLAALIRRLRAYRASDKLLAAVIAQPQPEQARPSAETLKLRQRFEEAVATLKQQRRGGRSLYDLPWYVIIGAPGSGKTTALLNSGLNFPLDQRVGKGSLRGVGGTRNCDWWFTDEAVFLDTAGRYTTQDSDAASDSAAWSEFLSLLRKYRPRRPLNGVILTINAADLMSQGDATREAHVEAARRRLNELNRELRVRLPVYVMVTKCDLVAGFAEYFDDLAQESREQVWGVTFSHEQTARNEATEVYPAEFDVLMARLNERVFARLEEVRDARRRTRVFAFPQQMAALRDVLSQFVGDVFASTQFDQQMLLRGVYFTSGTQEGTPVNRLLGGIGRRFGVAPEAVVRPSGPGKAYFVERLLKEVLIGESGLAGVNRRVEGRNAAAQLGAYAAMGLVAAAGVIALSVSYSRNRAYLAQTATDIAAVPQQPPGAAAASLEALLPRLNALRAVVDSADRYRSDTSWTLRWGLYQGGAVGNSARDAYLRELDGRLLPLVAARLKARLVEYSSEPTTLYAYLKAYLMLGQPDHLDRKFLQNLTDREWNTSNRGAGSGGTGLATHFQSLLDDSGRLRPIAMDPAMVAQATSTIRQASIPRMMYSQLKQSYADDKRTVRLNELAGLTLEKVLKRKSGSLSEPIPALYGQAVFKELTGPDTTALVKTFAADDWMWGDSQLFSSPAKLAAEVTNLYEQDYIAAWDAILDDLQFVSFSTVSDLSNGLLILTRPPSPLVGLLRAVLDNTLLVESPKAAEPSGALSTVRDKIAAGIGRVIKDAKGEPVVLPGAMVAAHFQPIQLVMAGEPGDAPIDRILSLIGQIQGQLGTLGRDVAGGDVVVALFSPELRALLQSLQQQADTLPPALRTLIKQIGHHTEAVVKSDASGRIAERYDRQVRPACLELVANRYPFARDSKDEMTLIDFGRAFGFGGVFDKFFDDHLEPQVDTSRRPWRPLPGAANLSSRMLQQFEEARQVRDMFFTGGGQLPALSFSVALNKLDATAARFVLDIDGQITDAGRGAGFKWPMRWPGQTGRHAFAAFTGPFTPESTTRFNGPWAWFRMIDATRRGSPDAQKRVLLDLRSASYRGQVTVEASSASNNPFATEEWRDFSCAA